MRATEQLKLKQHGSQLRARLYLVWFGLSSHDQQVSRPFPLLLTTLYQVFNLQLYTLPPLPPLWRDTLSLLES